MALPGDVLVHFFLSLGIQSLLQCCCVCKGWRDMIRCAWFRKQWSERHLHEQSSVLLSFAKHDSSGKRLGIRRWHQVPPNSSSDGGYAISSYLNISIPGFSKSRFDIVASSNGLVCACLKFKDSYRDLFRYAVGNPVTDEWFHLPPPPEFQDSCFTFSNCRQYTLQAQSSGEFKLQVLDFCIDEKAEFLLVYSSQTQSWSILKPPACTPKTAMHDLDEGWISVKPPIRFRYEDTRDSLNFITSWSYKGETYLAGYIDEYVCPMDILAWKASSLEKQEQVSVTPAGDRVSWFLWDTGADEEQILDSLLEEEPNRDLEGDGRYAFHGEGKLCAFAAHLAHSSRSPGVYDVNLNRWYLLEEFNIRTGFHRPKLHCTQAVVYHPSLIKPAGIGVGWDTTN